MSRPVIVVDRSLLRACTYGVIFLFTSFTVVTQAPTKLSLLLAAVLVAFTVATLVGFRRMTYLALLATVFNGVHATTSAGQIRPESLIPLLALAPAVMEGRLGDLTKWFRYTPVRLAFGFILLNAVSSLAFSPSLFKSIGIVLVYGVDLLLVLMLLAEYENRGSDLLRHSVQAAGIAVGLASLSWVMFHTVHTRWGLSHEITPRATGFTFEPNILAQIAAMWVFIVLTRHQRLGWRGATYIGLALFAIAGSGTRAAFLGLAAGLLIWSFQSGARAIRILFITLFGAVGLAAAGLVGGGVLAPILDKLRHIVDFSGGTGHVRLLSWQTAISDMHGWGWVFGLGANSFGQRHIDPTQPFVTRRWYLGNLPLEALYDGGILGLAALVIAVVMMLHHMNQQQRWRAAGFLALFVILSTSSSPIFLGMTWVAFANGVLVATRNRKAAPHPPGEGVRGGARRSGLRDVQRHTGNRAGRPVPTRHG